MEFHEDLPGLFTKKWIEICDQSGKNSYNVIKEIRTKTPMLRSNLCDYSDAYVVVKEIITVTNSNDAQKKKKDKKTLHLKTMHHLLTAFQKLIVYKLTMQKI